MHFHHKFFTASNSRRGHKGQSVKLVNGTLFYIPSLVLVLWLLCVCVCVFWRGVEPLHMFLLKRPDKRWPRTMQWQQITVKWINQTVVWASDTHLWVKNITLAVPLQSCLWMGQVPHATKSTWSVSQDCCSVKASVFRNMDAYLCKILKDTISPSIYIFSTLFLAAQSGCLNWCSF